VIATRIQNPYYSNSYLRLQKTIRKLVDAYVAPEFEEKDKYGAVKVLVRIQTEEEAG